MEEEEEEEQAVELGGEIERDAIFGFSSGVIMYKEVEDCYCFDDVKILANTPYPDLSVKIKFFIKVIL